MVAPDTQHGSLLIFLYTRKSILPLFGGWKSWVDIFIFLDLRLCGSRAQNIFSNVSFCPQPPCRVATVTETLSSSVNCRIGSLGHWRILPVICDCRFHRIDSIWTCTRTTKLRGSSWWDQHNSSVTLATFRPRSRLSADSFDNNLHEREAVVSATDDCERFCCCQV